MNLLVVSVLLWGIAAWLWLRLRTQPEVLGEVMVRARAQAIFVLPRLFVGLLGAGFYAAVLPTDVVSGLIGPDSGARGLALAAGFGLLTPGGPIVAFAVAAAALDTAGPAQVLTYVTAWSILSLNRMLAWELPIMGAHFIAIRIGASLPVLAGIGLTALAILS